MAIQITSLSELAPEKIESMFTTLSALMQERHPEVELTRGVFHDLVLYFSSVLNAAMQENVDRVLQSNSLKSIAENPQLADDTLVDKVLSNYNMSRDTGTAAIGTATVVLQFNTLTTLSADTNLVGGGVTFSPTETFTFLPPGAPAISATDRVMTPVGDGTYIATITVQADTVGAAGNINRGTELVPDYRPNNILDIYATADFISGRDPATNAEYISKLAPALAAKTVGGRLSYAATIRAQAAFKNIPHISILGCGDAEQHRDQHGLFPISGGGKVDIYLQTNSYAQVRRHLLEATYVGPGTTGGIWKITLDRNVSPCLYEISRVAKTLSDTDNGYKIVNDARGVDFSALDFVPSLKYLYESTYTRYQTVNIQFEDTDTSIVSLVPNTSKAKYYVDTVSLPLVAEVQDFLSSRDVRSRTTDVLVRAAIPCFTKIAFQVRKDASDPDPDVAAIKEAVSKRIGEIGFTGQLHASHIAAAAQQLLTGKQAIGQIDMFGRLRRPDGNTIYLRDPNILHVPNDPQNLITGRTVTFLTRPEDVAVGVVAAGFSD